MEQQPNRILALDGGGIRGALTLDFLERIDRILREREENPNLLLCDFFDLVVCYSKPGGQPFVIYPGERRVFGSGCQFRCKLCT